LSVLLKKQKILESAKKDFLKISMEKDSGEIFFLFRKMFSILLKYDGGMLNL